MLAHCTHASAMLNVHLQYACAYDSTEPSAVNTSMTHTTLTDHLAERAADVALRNARQRLAEALDVSADVSSTWACSTHGCAALYA
jgi:CO/xanthine dehydrogenase Mo-binding subunit